MVKTINFMALQFVSRTSLPVLAKGAVGRESVTIHENGQIVLSKKVMDKIGVEADTLVALGFDTATRNLVVAVATPKIIKAVGGEGGCYTLRVSKKTKQGLFAASAFLQDPKDEIFGPNGNKYDYKSSGNQSFEAVVNEKEKMVSCVLPKGALAKKPVVARKKKDKGNEVATTGATTNKASAKEDELEELAVA